MIGTYEIFIASSWKNRERVRRLARYLRSYGFSVFDFTDPSCRDTEEIPPEKFEDDVFDPFREGYFEHLTRFPEYRAAVEENRKRIEGAKVVIMLLPCGKDATADWAYAVGRGKRTYIVGQPGEGERSPTHLWADGWFPDDEACARYICVE